MSKTEKKTVGQEAALETLEKFLRCPLYDGSEVLQRFRALPNAQYFEGKNPLERYVYVPGRRKDRVLLLAHADTLAQTRFRTLRCKRLKKK